MRHNRRRTSEGVAVGRDKHQRGGKLGDDYKQGGRLVRVFTHDGKWVKNIVLDRRIAGLYVDEQTNMLYGLDVNADEQIVKWEL